MPNELAELSALVGATVVAAEACGWGFENRTSIVTLADGTQQVVQRMTGHAAARHKLRLARMLPERLAAAGLRVPRLLQSDTRGQRPFAVRDFIPGVAGASLMSTVEGATAIALAMGALLPLVAAVSTVDAGLNDAWAVPARLAALSQRYLQRCRTVIGADAADTLAATIADIPALFTGRNAVFAHGDFCPVNVLIRSPKGGAEEHSAVEVVGLLDVEFARIADPLFDAAWWGWVVRYHHPERWVVAFPHLLAAAGIPDDEATRARIKALQHMRCLEVVDYHLRTARPDGAKMWAERLHTTLGWE